MAEKPAAEPKKSALERPPTHWCGLIMYDYDEDENSFYYYVFDYLENKAGAIEQVKFPGGTNSDRPKEQIDETLHREVRKETGLRILVDPKLIYEKHLPPDPRPHKDKEAHTQYCYLVRWDQCDGELITQPQREDDGDGKPGDYHKPLYPRTAKQLLNPLAFGEPVSKKLFWTHRDMLRAAMKELGDPDVMECDDPPPISPSKR